MAISDKHHIELARRLVACPRFRWMKGMAEIDGGVVTAVSAEGITIHVAIGFGARGRTANISCMNGLRPDLRDPATRGCVLELVREAWGDPALVTWRQPSGWTMGSAQLIPQFRVCTEAEALVHALEAAPDHAENP